jgi:hypothetical protein
LICQPGWEQVTHLDSHLLVPFLPPAAGMGAGWGGGCLPWRPGLALPQLFPRHALTLPGAPGLRSGGNSFRMPGLLSCLWGSGWSGPWCPPVPVARKPRLWAAHPPSPRGASDSEQVLCKSPPRHCILELTTGELSPPLKHPWSWKGPASPRNTRWCQCGARCYFL